MSECIAMPIAAGRLSAHFGHAESFVFISIDPAQPETQQIRTLTPPAHAPGVLPKWLAESGATTVIAGGMGPRAVSLMESQGIRCVLGVADLDPEDAVARYLDGSLITDQVQCSHGPDHQCSH